MRRRAVSDDDGDAGAASSSGENVARLLGRLKKLSAPERSPSTWDLSTAVDFAPLAGGAAPPAGTPLPFVAPLAVMRARARRRESAHLGGDGVFVRGTASARRRPRPTRGYRDGIARSARPRRFAPALPARTPFVDFDAALGRVDRDATPPPGSHAFVRVRGEAFLRVAVAARAFGAAARDAPGLALAPGPDQIELAGELETDGRGKLLRWIARAGTRRAQRSPVDLPRDLRWECVDEVDDAAARPRKVARLDDGTFAVKEHADPSPNCATRAPL